MSINDGGPAFPVVPNAHWTEWGMTLRDYFAAAALPVLCAEYCKDAATRGFDENWKMGVALDSYAMADAMLKSREVQP